MIRLAPLSATALIAAVALSAPAKAADQWTVDHDASTLGFIGKQSGNEFIGSFGGWTAEIAFSPEDLANSSVSVEIDMSTGEAGSNQRTNALPGSDWFDTDSFPTAAFTADVFRDLGDGAFEADGTLQIRDFSLPVTLPFTLEIDGNTALMSGALDINRTDYGVGQGEFSGDGTVAFGVTITVEISASR